MCRCQWGVGVRHTFLPAGTQFNIFTHQLYKPQHPHLWSAILVYQTSSRKRFDRGREGRKSYASYLHMSLNSYKQGSTAVSFMDCAKMSQPKSQRGCPGDSHSRGSLGSILKKKKEKVYLQSSDHNWNLFFKTHWQAGIIYQKQTELGQTPHITEKGIAK